LNSGREIIDRIVSQVANPVRWDLCMATLQSSGVTKALEVAPAGTLVGLLKRAAESIEGYAFKSPDDLAAAGQFVSSKG
jgi:[acyl-carrier-protein] S-malonyltransferase